MSPITLIALSVAVLAEYNVGASSPIFHPLIFPAREHYARALGHGHARHLSNASHYSIYHPFANLKPHRMDNHTVTPTPKSRTTTHNPKPTTKKPIKFPTEKPTKEPTTTKTPIKKTSTTEKPTKKPIATTKKPIATTKKPTKNTIPTTKPTKKPNPTAKPTKKPNPTTRSTNKPLLKMRFLPRSSQLRGRPDCSIYKGDRLNETEWDKLYNALAKVLQEEDYPPERMEVWSACKQVSPKTYQQTWIAAFWDTLTAQPHSCGVKFSHNNTTGILRLAGGPACHVEGVDLCPRQMLNIARCKYPYIL